MSRVAVVVPVLRLRRDTAGWSYRIPAGTPCLPGTLVIIPFRNRPTLGVVWEQRDDDLASHQISQILTAQPLVLAPHRQLIEYLAEAGLCSLSTALYVWLPRWMRRLPLTRSVQLQLMQPITANNTSQRAVILPGRRPVQEGLLSNQSTELLFSDSSEAQTERAFWRIANGSALLGVGKDGAVFAPWRNLQQLVIIDPEDISYYREQVPYLSLLGALEELARANRIKPQWRSQLPTAAAQALWGSGAKGNDQLPDLIGHIDLRHEPAFGDVTLSLIQETLARSQKVLILHNAYDHLGEPMPDGGRKSVTGVQGLSRDLARKLGLSELPDSVILGTRLILQRPYEQVGLTIALNLDQLLQTPLFADQLHGWSDLGHLLKYGGHFLLQSHYPEHPLVQSLLLGRWSQYVESRIANRCQSGLPPYCQQIVISIKMGEGAVATGLYERLLPLIREPWHLTYPFEGSWRKQLFTHLMLTAPLGERLPSLIRQALVALPSPWKVQRSPWHII